MDKRFSPKPIMIINDREYIKPSKQARILSILDALAIDCNRSQHELGQSSGLSRAMVNQYLRSFQEQGLLCYQPTSGKSFSYVLTEEGEALRRKMFARHCSELVRLYSALKQSILDKVQRLSRRGVRKVVLFGASETCEVVLSALRQSSFEVAALVDNDQEKHGKIFQGQVIASPRILEDLPCQAVIITTYGHQDDIRRQLAPLAQLTGMEIVTL